MTTMTFKKALIAHLQGERVECRFKKDGCKLNFIDEFCNLSVYSVVNHDHDELYEFRLAPRTITINGEEIEAPIEPLPGDLCWSFNMQGHVISYHYATGIGQELADNGNAFSSREAARAAFEAVTKALKQKP